MIYPDQEKGGTLLIPNTVCLLKNSPNPETGKLLIDFLLSEDVESLLAYSPSAQIPLRSSVSAPNHIQQLKEIKAWDVDFEQTLKIVKDATQWAMDQLVY